MSRNLLLCIKGVDYSARAWPNGMPNPGKNKYLVFLNGDFVATAKTKVEFERNARNGYYDACVDAVQEVVG